MFEGIEHALLAKHDYKLATRIVIWLNFSGYELETKIIMNTLMK